MVRLGGLCLASMKRLPSRDEANITEQRRHENHIVEPLNETHVLYAVLPLVVCALHPVWLETSCMLMRYLHITTKYRVACLGKKPLGFRVANPHVMSTSS